MNNIIAGDPAPTNPTDRLRVKVLAGLGAAFDGTADPAARAEDLLDRYDELKHAETLSRFADLLGRRATLYGSSLTVNEVIDHLRRLVADGGAR